MTRGGGRGAVSSPLGSVPPPCSWYGTRFSLCPSREFTLYFAECGLPVLSPILNPPPPPHHVCGLGEGEKQERYIHMALK